jgi:hypothetical protein
VAKNPRGMNESSKKIIDEKLVVQKTSWEVTKRKTDCTTRFFIKAPFSSALLGITCYKLHLYKSLLGNTSDY